MVNTRAQSEMDVDPEWDLHGIHQSRGSAAEVPPDYPFTVNLEWAKTAHKIQRIYHTRADQEKRLKTLRLREEIVFDPLRAKRQCPGDIRLRHCTEMLDQFTMNGTRLNRSAVQRIFHKWFIQATLPKLYREDWDESSQRILAQHNLDRIHAEILCITPRRYGKTTSIAMYVATMLLCVPGIKIVVFSASGRASTLLQRQVAKFINSIPGGTDRILVQNKENLFIGTPAMVHLKSQFFGQSRRLQDQDGVSELYTLPASVNSTSSFAAAGGGFQGWRDQGGFSRMMMIATPAG